MATKLEIETNLEEKVVNVISKIYDENKFAVTTNVVLVSPNNTQTLNTQQSFGALQLEGILPAVPQKRVQFQLLIPMITEYKLKILLYGLIMI